MDDRLLHPADERVKAAEAGLWWRSGNGPGLIECRRAPVKGIDRHLLELLQSVCQRLGIHMVIADVDSGRYPKSSRHRHGRAVAISQLSHHGNDLRPCTLANPVAKELVTYLLNHGFRVGEGRENPGPGLLFGPIWHCYNNTGQDFSDRLRISLGKK
jgi:hypothetical protein